MAIFVLHVDLDQFIAAAALRALGRFRLDRPVRLVGVRAELAPGRMLPGVENAPQAIGEERGERP